LRDRFVVEGKPGKVELLWSIETLVAAITPLPKSYTCPWTFTVTCPRDIVRCVLLLFVRLLRRGCRSLIDKLLHCFGSRPCSDHGLARRRGPRFSRRQVRLHTPTGRP
jgi:hypothetical protein